MRQDEIEFEWDNGSLHLSLIPCHHIFCAVIGPIEKFSPESLLSSCYCNPRTKKSFVLGWKRFKNSFAAKQSV